MVAVRFDPPAVQADRPFTIDALALAPRGEPVRKVTASTCAEDPLAETTTYTDLACFGAEDLAIPLGEVPATFTPHAYTCSDTEETYSSYYGYYGYGGSGSGGSGYPGLVPEGCSSRLPVLVEARTDAGSGFGNVFFTVATTAPDQPAIWSLPQTLEAAGPARAGGRVELTYHIDSRDPTVADAGFHWYVDDGELERTGLTSPTAIDDTGVTTTNTLHIPEAWHGPLRVAVVAAAEAFGETGADTTWRVLVLEVP